MLTFSTPRTMVGRASTQLAATTRRWSCGTKEAPRASLIGLGDPARDEDGEEAAEEGDDDDDKEAAGLPPNPTPGLPA